MDYYDIVVYWGYGHMDPVWSLLLLLRTWMGYGYIVIQVVCWVELSEQRRLCPIFCENMGHPKSIGIPQVDGLSTGPTGFEASHGNF